MAVAVAQWSSTTGSNSSPYTCAVPNTSSVTGELWVVFCSCEPSVGGLGTTAFSTSSTGWTTLSTTADGGFANIGVFIGIVGTASTTLSVAMSAGGNSFCSIGYRLSGWDGTLANVKAVQAKSPSNGSANPPSLAPGLGTKEFMWLVAMSNDVVGREATAAPTDFSNLHVITQGSGFAGSTLATAERLFTASSLDPGAFTVGSSDQWTAATIAVPPADIPVVEGQSGDVAASGVAQGATGRTGVPSATLESAASVPGSPAGVGAAAETIG